MQSYGPLFPFAQYTLLNSLLTSVACYIALGIVIITFLFPESINHATLISISDLLGKIKSLIDLQQQILESTPDDLGPGSPLSGKILGGRVGMLTHLQQCTSATEHVRGLYS